VRKNYFIILISVLSAPLHLLCVLRSRLLPCSLVDFVSALMTTAAPTALHLDYSPHTSVREVASAARRTV
jgi:hypothetical protein